MSKTLQVVYLTTPLGIAKISGDTFGVQSVVVLEKTSENLNNIPEDLSEPLKNCRKQLKEYFDHKRETFDVKINPQGTSFQKKVWKELQKIPYGKSCSYKEQALKLGDLKSIRAVASANGKNPLWIVIPCHRVIGSNGDLTGYAGGIWRKKWLLEHESKANQLSLF